MRRVRSASLFVPPRESKFAVVDVPSPAPVRSELPDGVDPLVWETERQALEQRFAPHLDAAGAALRHAEQELDDARSALSRARDEAASRQYQSDRRVFMRAAVDDELESLSRKTTEKKLRSAHRYLVARAVELADAEVAGYLADQNEEAREREHGVVACEHAERRAAQTVDAARAMHARVLAAYDAAERGLVVLLTGAPDGS